MLKYFSSIWAYRAFLKSHKSSCISVVTIFNAAERNIVVLLLWVTFLPVLSLINVLHLLMVEFHILMMVIPLAMHDLYHINLKLGRKYTRTEPAPKE